MEAKATLIKSVMSLYLSPSLLTKRSGYNDSRPMVNWTFGLEHFDETDDAYRLEIHACFEDPSSAYHDEMRTSVRRWHQLGSVTKEEIANALFYALTWDGSPYYFNGKQWHRKAYIYG